MTRRKPVAASLVLALLCAACVKPREAPYPGASDHRGRANQCVLIDDPLCDDGRRGGDRDGGGGGGSGGGSGPNG